MASKIEHAIPHFIPKFTAAATALSSTQALPNDDAHYWVKLYFGVIVSCPAKPALYGNPESAYAEIRNIITADWDNVAQFSLPACASWDTERSW